MIQSPLEEADIFQIARDIGTPQTRAAYLQQACGNDAAMLSRVVALLKIAEEEQSFLERPPEIFSPTLASLQVTESPGTFIGPFKLLEQIGEGGFGVVFVAEQSQPVRRKVALKILKPGMDTRQVIARFEAERQALALMDHPHIAKVLDAGATESGRPFFVMELVKGIPITDYCEQSRLGVRERLALFVDVCHAVQHAHQKGIIHRDLKPSNILVTEIDGKPIAKVIDFGIAKATGQQLTDKTLYTGFTQLVGTPLYMSPEQAALSGVDVDTRSDVYSLGVLLYELLTGTTPFSKETLSKVGYDELRRIIREEEPPRPSTRLSTLQGQAGSTLATGSRINARQLSRQLRGELDWIVMQALEKDRNRRYESASALAADVERYLRDEPVQACPPSPTYRLRKFLRRHKSRVGVVGLASTMLVLVTVVAGAMYGQRLSAQRRTAELVQQSLVAARTAIDAGDLMLAGRHMAEAQGRLGDQGDSFAELAVAVDKMAAEWEARLRDYDAYGQFVKFVGESQLHLGIAELGPGNEFARAALRIYGIEDDSHWTNRLEKSYLKSEQKQQVRELAYETLVLLADDITRWEPKRDNDPRADSKSLALLDKARLFHEPTHAYWFVRRSVLNKLKDDDARKEANVQLQATPPKSAWDYYLPGHSAGWSGNHEEAIKSYQAALKVQPSHYPSLFFLGNLLSSEKVNRLPEAMAYFTAATALRPTNINPYRDRARCYLQLGRTDEAEAEFDRALARADNNEKRFFAFYYRYDFYVQQGREEKADGDFDQLVAIGNRLLQGMGQEEKDFAQVQKKLPIDTSQISEPAVALNIANVISILASHLHKFPDRKAESEELHRKAIAVKEKLVLAYPTNKYRQSLARSQADYGNLLLSTSLTDAITEYRKSRELLEQLTIQLPANESYQLELAVVTSMLAFALVDKGDLDAAYDEAGKSVAIAEKLTVNLRRRSPNGAFAHEVWAIVQYRRGEYQAALASFQKGIEIRKGSVDVGDKLSTMIDEKNSPDADALFVLAMTYWQLGDKDEARKVYLKAVEYMQKHDPDGLRLRRYRTEAESLLKEKP